MGRAGKEEGKGEEEEEEKEEEEEEEEEETVEEEEEEEKRKGNKDSQIRRDESKEDRCSHLNKVHGIRPEEHATEEEEETDVAAIGRPKENGPANRRRPDSVQQQKL